MKPERPVSLLITGGLLAGGYLLSRIDFVVECFGRVSLWLFLEVGKFIFSDLTFEGEVIRTGRVEVPWTGDCSGMNLLLILLAIGAWVSREQALNRSWILRLLSLIPAAVLANVLRILALTGYRNVAYPAIESPQMHYFIGFVCVAPFALLALPAFRLNSLFLVLQTAAVMCLLAPHLDLGARLDGLRDETREGDAIDRQRPPRRHRRGVRRLENQRGHPPHLLLEQADGVREGVGA